MCTCNQGYTRIPGVAAAAPTDRVGLKSVLAVNRSGVTLEGGQVLVLNPNPASLVPGQPIPVALSTLAGDPLACGVVPPESRSIPDGAQFYMQVAGLCPAMRVSGDLPVAYGDSIGTSATGGVGARTDEDGRLAVYCDEDYADPATELAAVFLTNPLGL